MAGLGDMRPSDFCDSFFHVKATPEAGVADTCCLRAPAGCCSGKTTALVAQLIAADGATVLFSALHRNQSQREHAEDLLMRDERLLDAAAAAANETGSAGMTVRIWLTIQPCHFSSGDDNRSCTLSLARWCERALAPRGVDTVEIKAAYPYRTHWEPAHMTDADLEQLGRRAWGGCDGGGGRGARRPPLPRISAADAIARARALLQNAREGTRLLVGPCAGVKRRITLSAFGPTDWEVLLRVCCGERALQRWADREPPFSQDIVDARAAMDAFTASVFDTFRDSTE